MHLLLTGATGFLGRHLVAAATDWTVTRVTRATVATDTKELALGPAPWTQEDFARAIAEARPDMILHCAGTAHSRDARSCFESNTVLAADLLAATARADNPPRVILIGSAAEHGIVRETSQPVTETYPCEPITDYAVAKRAQSLLGHAAGLRGQKVLVARLFNAVGVGMPAALALPSFARQIVGPSARSVMRVGDLSAARDFIDVEEAARLLLALATMPEWPWPVVNICSGRAYRLRNLLDQLIAASGKDVHVEIDPALLRPGDMPILIGSTARLESVGLAPLAPDFPKILPLLLDEARTTAAHC